MKRCIFHYPNPIVAQPGKGSALRPNKMRAAFEQIGYQVDEVTGYGAERKEKIDRIKRNMEAGVRYDFLYSESVNMPTVLSEKDHVPRYPALDFAFFRHCRKNGIPTGLFYRDIHWKFPLYKEGLAWWKLMLSLMLFRCDLIQYRKTVNLLYLPSDRIRPYVPGHNTKPLPPGGELRSEVYERRKLRQKEAGKLQAFYVGSVSGGVYDLTAFCRAVCAVDGVELTICTPREHWETAQEKYADCLCGRIRVVHEVSEHLAPYYEAADVFCCCLGVNEYTRLAMPIKVFEALSCGTPVMISDGIAAAELVERENFGWKVDNTAESFAQLLTFLRDHPEEIEEKTRNAIAAAPEHTWQCRAQQVAEDLTAWKEKEKKR